MFYWLTNMVEYSPEREQSDFNQAIATLMRIHSALLELNIATKEYRHSNKHALLCILYQEVRPMLNDKERLEFKTAKDTLDLANRDLLKVINQRKKVIPGKIINVFNEFEQALRDMVQKKGMGLPPKADSRYALKGK
jgi:hypothetical protein